MAVIRFKRGTLAQLVTAAGNNELSQGEPYLVTDLDMVAMGTGVDSYVFSGTLLLAAADPIPDGYIGMIARLPA